MSMAQLFLTNPVIIFHPPILSGAAIYCEYSTFSERQRYIFARQISATIFFSANAGLRFNRDSSFFSLPFFAGVLLSPPRDNTSETRIADLR